MAVRGHGQERGGRADDAGGRGVLQEGRRPLVGGHRIRCVHVSQGGVGWGR